jgi:hypothetical protein
LIIFVFWQDFFGRIRVWTQGYQLASRHCTDWDTTSVLLALLNLEVDSCEQFCKLGLILPSQVARITGMRYQHQACLKWESANNKFNLHFWYCLLRILWNLTWIITSASDHPHRNRMSV